MLRGQQHVANISVENQRKTLGGQIADNDKKEAETQRYMIETTLKPDREMDWRILAALNGNGDPRNNIALAFRQLAENADKIGNLNISPDLLDSILSQKGKSK